MPTILDPGRKWEGTECTCPTCGCHFRIDQTSEVETAASGDPITRCPQCDRAIRLVTLGARRSPTLVASTWSADASAAARAYAHETRARRPERR